MSGPTTALTWDEARERARVVSVEAYDISLDLTGAEDPARPGFRTTTVVTFTAAAGGRTFIDVAARALTSVQLNGVQLPPDAPGGRLMLPGLHERNTLIVEGEFEYSDDRQGVHRFVDGADGAVYLSTMTFLSESQRIHPCFDQPDLKATYRFTAEVPSGWTFASNGESRMTSSGPISNSWETDRTPRLPPYVAAFAAGPYHVVHDAGDPPITLYCRASLADALPATELVALLRAGVDFFVASFDLAYPFGKLDQVFVPEFGEGVAMENAALVFLDDGFLFRGAAADGQLRDRDYTVLHELAHMWFGDLVTTRWWDDTWLNEAFATYAGTLAQTETTDRRDAWTTFALAFTARALLLDQLSTTHPVAGTVADTTEALVAFDAITYNKGAAVLKQLVSYVGRDTFLRGVGEHLRVNAFGNADLHDLMRELERAGGRDLQGWAAEWLGTSGANTLRAAYDLDAHGRITGARLQQTGLPGEPLRSHRIALGLYHRRDGAFEREHRVEVDVSGAVTPLPQLEGLSAPDVLLTNDDDLTYARVRFDPRTEASLDGSVWRLRGSLARAVVHIARLDELRQGERDAAAAFESIVAELPHETDIGVLAHLLETTRTLLNDYLPPDAARRQRFAELAREHSLNLPVDSVEAHEWTLAYLETAGGTALIADLRADATGVLAAASHELRWRILVELTAWGEAGPDALEALVAGTPASVSERWIPAVRAVSDDAASVWARIIDEAGGSLAERRREAQVFWHRALAGSRAAWIPVYFEQLAGFWGRDDGGNTAFMLTEELYPLTHDASIVPLTDAWLATSPPAAQAAAVARLRDLTAIAVRLRG